MTNISPVALVHGAGCSIGNELVTQLSALKVRVVLYDELDRHEMCSPTASALGSPEPHRHLLASGLSSSEVIENTIKLYGRIDYLFNCFTPLPGIVPADVFNYPQQLLDRAMAAAQAMVTGGSGGAIVNQCFMGSMFQDTLLEASILMTKGSITGLTRELCCKFGKSGIRINTIQLGLIDLPETKSLLSEKTLVRKTPVGRWGTPREVAKFMVFLALKNGYMTGQSICFDGGLTAGNTGT